MNILEDNVVGAEQPSAAQNPSPNTPGRQSQPLPPGAGQPDPLTRLKARPKEDLDWACELDLTMTRAQAIAAIKNRLGIDLRWPTTYSLFSHASHTSQNTAKSPEKHNEPVQETCGKTQLYAENHNFRSPLFSRPAAPVNGDSHRTQLSVT
jgi:hypothetical protein